MERRVGGWGLSTEHELSEHSTLTRETPPPLAVCSSHKMIRFWQGSSVVHSNFASPFFSSNEKSESVHQ